MTKFYTGIGSRSTPADVCQLMRHIAMQLAAFGWALRSGAARGADMAFESGADPDTKQIFLPWPGFNGHSSDLHGVGADALAVAERYHPAWHQCSQGARKLHGRNSYQVLGPDLRSPSRFILCWTENAKGFGGTGQAIRIARGANIPVYDFGDQSTLDRWMDAVNYIGSIDGIDLQD